MMTSLFKRILALLFLGVAMMAGAQNVGIEADSAYVREQYGRAIELYNEALVQYGPDSDTYYNLGNAYYRNGNPGRAVLSYERALRLDPTNRDARHNLDFVRSRLEDLPEDDSSFLSNVHHAVLGTMKANSWAWTAFGVFLLLLGAVSLYIFAPGVTLRKAGFFGGIVLLFLFMYTIYVAYDSAALARTDRYAIVTVPSTYINSMPRAPRNSSEPVVSIHEGTKVEITDSVATPDDPQSAVWYNVKINNGTRAWVRGSDVEKI